MPFAKGKSGNPKGREPGAKNKLTLTVKEAFEEAFKNLQEQPGARLADWAKNNPNDFYRIASKLIPNAVEGEVKGVLTLVQATPTDEQL